jgi:BRCT domain type II-containing protein
MQGKTVVITGATSGLGRATAPQLYPDTDSRVTKQISPPPLSRGNLIRFRQALPDVI